MTFYTAIIIVVWLALAVLSILVHENNRISNQTKIIMYVTYAVTGVAALAEWLGVQFNGNTSIPVGLLKTVKVFDYILTPIAGGAIALQLRTKTIWKKIIFGILIVNVLFQILSATNTNKAYKETLFCFLNLVPYIANSIMTKIIIKE